jgi:hypothetical protein
VPTSATTAAADLGEPARDDRKAAIGTLIGAVMALALCGVIAWVSYGPDPMPPLERLLTASGELRALSYSHSKNSEVLELRLDGQPLRFEVPSQAGDLQRLHDLLEAESGRVSLLYDPSHRRHPWWSEGDDFYLAYGLERGGRALLTYGETRQGFASDQRVGRWFAPLLALVALLLGHHAWRMWQPRAR